MNSVKFFSRRESAQVSVRTYFPNLHELLFFKNQCEFVLIRAKNKKSQ